MYRNISISDIEDHLNNIFSNWSSSLQAKYWNMKVNGWHGHKVMPLLHFQQCHQSEKCKSACCIVPRIHIRLQWFSMSMFFNYDNEWGSDCLIPSDQFFSYINHDITFWDDVSFILDQYSSFCSASLLQQKSAARHVAPLTFLQPYSELTSLCSSFLMQQIPILQVIGKSERLSSTPTQQFFSYIMVKLIFNETTRSTLY